MGARQQAQDDLVAMLPLVVHPFEYDAAMSQGGHRVVAVEQALLGDQEALVCFKKTTAFTYQGGDVRCPLALVHHSANRTALETGGPLYCGVGPGLCLWLERRTS
jgi:hypothetical protein